MYSDKFTKGFVIKLRKMYRCVNVSMLFNYSAIGVSFNLIYLFLSILFILVKIFIEFKLLLTFLNTFYYFKKGIIYDEVAFKNVMDRLS